MKKNKIVIIVLGILISAIIFSLNFNNKHVLNYEKMESTDLAIFLNDTKTNQIPTKDSGYYFNREKTNCTNGATINWNSVTWNPEVHNLTTTRTKCELHFTTIYTEGILNGTDPVIKNELIPVSMANDGTVKKADLNSKWYEYANQKWANAVILQNSYDVLNKQGKVVGATKSNGYVTFDGVDDYIDLGLENYDFGNQITIGVEGRIKSNAFSYFLDNVENGGVSIEISNYEVYAAIHINGEYRRTSRYKLDPEKYYTILASYDGSVIKLFVNGEVVAELSYSGVITRSTMPFLIAGNPNKNDVVSFSSLDIKKTIIYSRTLSEEEVKENMSDGIKISDNSGLLSYVNFTNKGFSDNEIIPEDVIESYFVWIPRYRYKIFDAEDYSTRGSIDNTSVQTIEIEFETKETPVSTGSAIGSWLTHPAFTAFNTNGMWVGKYETSKTSGSDNERNGDAVQIKPNVSSWRSIQVGNAFYTSYDYKRDLDSHMMKNTEWGAVAYLQHSAYGSQASVRINNNSSYITGYSANNEPTCGYTGTNEECNRYCNDGTCNQAYNTTTGYLASTTANITGIYDMAGGAWEYVMGVMVDQQGNPMSGRNSMYNSGFKGTLGCPTCDSDTSGITSITSGYDWPEAKYYDTYAYSTDVQQFNRRILGDATGEMGPFGLTTYLTQTISIGSWYADYAYFVSSAIPWFVRGIAYNYGSDAGVFAFIHAYGHTFGYVSFRVVLMP